MSALTSKEIVFVKRPQGKVTADIFDLRHGEARQPQDGEIQVKNHWMSVDPYMRSRMDDRKSYVPPFVVGEVLQGGAVGEVLASRAEGFAPGDLVLSMYGWREAWTAPVRPAGAPMLNIQKIETMGMPPQAFLNVAGLPGITAYAGLFEIGHLKAGDRVFVSAGAGAVGSIVCQIAKAKGCFVVGSAGGEEKTAYLKKIGCDAVIDYKQHEGVGALSKALMAASPEGIDLYFENVGGDHLSAAINAMNDFGRIVVCGMIAQYDAPLPGPYNLPMIIMKRLRVQGFIATDHRAVMGQFIAEMAGWVKSGAVTWEETVLIGVENAPVAFMQLFEGANLGKMLVKLSN
jgi:NADPH-dependent curcumin reductase CurA